MRLCLVDAGSSAGEIAAAKLSHCTRSGETACHWKTTAEGITLRCVLQLFLSGPDPAGRSGELTIKIIHGEGFQQGRAALQSQAEFGHPEPMPAPHKTQQARSHWVLLAGNGALF